MKPRSNNPEQILQIAVADFLDLAMPADVWWTAIGHGGGGRLRGAFLKAMGVKAGVPDIIGLFRQRFFSIEMKTETGKLSKAQRSTHERIVLSGGVVTVCRSVEAVEQFLIVLGIPLQASVTPKKLKVAA